MSIPVGGTFLNTTLPLTLFLTKTKKAMDTLYLLRFNKNTPIAELTAEQQDLFTDIKAHERQIIDLDPLSSYSQVAAEMRKLATCKAKKSYIERLISIWENSQNRNNPELYQVGRQGRNGASQELFPQNYYGDYPD